jgi:hypothetical protein
MSRRDIKIQAIAIKSRPDILIFQGASVGGHEKAGTSETLENKNGLHKCPEYQNLFPASIVLLRFQSSSAVLSILAITIGCVFQQKI